MTRASPRRSTRGPHTSARPRRLAAAGGVVLVGTLAYVLTWGARPAAARADGEVAVHEVRARTDEPLLATFASALAQQVQPLLDASPGGELLLRATHELGDDAPRPDALRRAVLAPMQRILLEHERFVVEQQWGGTDGETDFARMALARGFEVALSITLSVDGPWLLASATVWSGAPGWEAVFRPRLQRIGRVSARAPLDAQLRRYVAPLPRMAKESVTARAIPLPSRDYVGAAAAELDGDPGAELVLLSAAGVEVVELVPARVTGLRLTRIGEAPLPELELDPSPPRRTLGTAMAHGGGVHVRLSSHAEAFEVHLDGGRVQLGEAEPCPEGGFPLRDGCAERVRGRDWFTERLQPRAGRDEAPPPAPSPFYARRTRTLRRPDGSTQRVEACVSPEGRLSVRTEGSRGSGAAGYGTALAMADVDHDGMAELLTSSARAIGDGDELRVLRIRPDGAVIAVWKSDPLDGTVLHAFAADLQGDGRTELLAIEQPPAQDDGPARLWIIR